MRKLLLALLLLAGMAAAQITYPPNLTVFQTVPVCRETIGGATTCNISLNAGDTGFSQAGITFKRGADGRFGFFYNVESYRDYFTLYDYAGNQDRFEFFPGNGGRLLLQPAFGNVGAGPKTGYPARLLTVGGGDILIGNDSTLGSENLTNGALTSGTSWSASGDCTLTANAATCTYSAGGATTISQDQGSLAVAGKANRMYKLTYVVSGVAGSPTAFLETMSAFARLSNPDVVAYLDLRNGSKTLYFQSNTAPTSFVITMGTPTAAGLTTGQAVTIDTLSLKEMQAGDAFVGGGVYSRAFGSVDNCIDSAGDAACGSAAAGSFVIDATDTDTVVSTTQVTANSQIFLQLDASLGTRLSVTCNTTLAAPYVTARTAGTSFTVTVAVAPTTNPACYSFFIVN